jgi:hypothetical protein
MSYIRSMDTVEELATLYVAAENANQLIIALEDMGFEGLEVRPISGGYGLFIDDTLIAAALSDDAADATEKLLDRCADKFFHDIMEV